MTLLDALTRVESRIEDIVQLIVDDQDSQQNHEHMIRLLEVREQLKDATEIKLRFDPPFGPQPIDGTFEVLCSTIVPDNPLETLVQNIPGETLNRARSRREEESDLS